VLVLVLAVLTVSYASSMRAYLEQRRHIESLKQNIASSEVAIASLQREKRRWSDPAYIRTVAHQRLGWVLPGEIGFQVIDDNGKALGRHDSLSDPNSVTASNRPLWWQSAWGSVVAAGKPEVPKADVPQPVTRIKVPKSSSPNGTAR
jgi:cell division protein FtsB